MHSFYMCRHTFSPTRLICTAYPGNRCFPVSWENLGMRFREIKAQEQVSVEPCPWLQKRPLKPLHGLPRETLKLQHGREPLSLCFN